MAYRFDWGEPLGDGLRRVLLEELDNAAIQLADVGAEALDVAVHESRKSLKRARTVLRLLRDTLGRNRFAAADDRLRTAAGVLAGLRDAKVVLDALDGLTHGGRVADHTVADLRAQLSMEYAQEHRRVAQEAGPRAEATERIAAGRADAARWRLEGDDLRAVVESAIRRLYGQGRKRMGAAMDDPAAVHDWRKRVKDLGHCVQLLAASWPEVLDPLAAEVRRLWELLGEHHDLSVLDRVAEQRRGAFASADDAASLHAAIAVRQQQLRADAFSLGRRVYAEPPKRFAQRLCSYVPAEDAASRPGAPGTARLIPAAARQCR